MKYVNNSQNKRKFLGFKICYIVMQQIENSAICFLLYDAFYIYKSIHQLML